MTTWIISSETVDQLLVVVYPVAPAGHPAESAFDHPATGSTLKCGLESMWAPALSKISVAVRLTMRRQPSVSTTIWRLRPTIFLHVVVDFRPRVAGVRPPQLESYPAGSLQV